MIYEFKTFKKFQNSAGYISKNSHKIHQEENNKHFTFGGNSR